MRAKQEDVVKARETQLAASKDATKLQEEQIGQKKAKRKKTKKVIIQVTGHYQSWL